MLGLGVVHLDYLKHAVIKLIYRICTFTSIHISTILSTTFACTILIYVHAPFQEGCCDLSDVSYLVLDEADRMLDQGRLKVSHYRNYRGT